MLIFICCQQYLFLDSIQEQCELEKDKSENNYSSPPSIQEDWILSFKNERKNDAKPMTLYSKRMMQKFSLESKVQENKNLKSIEINQNQNIISEKEPGELTDDESEIEKSKEFQEVAKAAVFESKVFDKKPVVEREKFLKDNLNQESFGNDFLMAEPEKIKSKPFSENLAKDTVLSESQTISSQEKLILEKKIDCSKEAREVIEFSPFKNNYKLIEISPVKASESIRLLEEHNNKLIVNSDAQRQVEASVFNLLSSLSGVPVDINGHENHSEKFKLENNNTQVPTVEINKTLDKPDEVQCESLNDKQGETDEPLKFFEEKKNVCQLQNVFSSKNFKKKNNLFQKAIDKNHEKEEEKKISSVKDVKNVENSAEVSGTSQFLDFFLLTSSPNPKPVLAAEEEKSITNLQKKNIFDSSNQKSDENVILGSQAEVKESEQKVTKTFSYNDSKSKKRKDSFARDTQIKGPEKINEKNDENLAEVQKKNEKLLKLKNNKRKEIECKSAESNLGGDKKKLIKNENEEAKDEKNKRKRKLSECDGEMPMEKKTKLDRNERSKETTIDLINVLEEEEQKGEQRKVKEDISFFEFFKPITKKEGTETEKIGIGEVPSTTDFKMTRTMSLTGVLHLETPSKCVEKLKNVMINEQTIYQVLDSKNNNSSFSPLIGAKLVEMTPRRLLKNDLMLTDSEDDSVLRLNQEDEGLEQGDGDNGEISQSENSECESDSGASAFVDLL